MSYMLQNIIYEPEDSGGRSMGLWVRKNGEKTNVLLEWRPSAPAGLDVFLARVAMKVPSDSDRKRPEEARTLTLRGAFREPERIAIVYKCPERPLNLRDVIVKVPKPSPEDRRVLAGIVATKIRSLHVHCCLGHGALRPESFLFFGGSNSIDFTSPYIVDWGRSSYPTIHQHPQYAAGRPRWFYDVWSLMIILSEIAEWRLADAGCRDERELLEKKAERKQLVTDPRWKGEATAKVFQYGFNFIDQSRATLELVGKPDIKRFFDILCELLATPAPQG